MIQNNSYRTGFALLMTLMVVSVIVSITAAIIELSLKQLELSVTTRDSEIAFEAANAGMECARYARRILATDLENPDINISLTSFPCFGIANQKLKNEDATIPSTVYVNNGEATKVHFFTSNFDWATGDRCSKLKMLVINVDPNDSPLVLSNLDDLFVGYPAGVKKTCDSGSYCTIAQVTGYSETCSEAATPDMDTVRREILLEF